MSGLRRALERSWEGGGGGTAFALTPVTLPLSWVWGAVTAVRNKLHDRRRPEVIEGMAVVSIGNLAVGGTGKTPVSAWVVGRFLGRGIPSAIVSSGYGEDEVSLHRRWSPGAVVLADRDRWSALERAREGGARVAVLDDAFQHRRVARDLDVVLLAAEHLFPASVLPRGPYREPPTALRRADHVVITRRTADEWRAREVAAELERLVPGMPTSSVALLPGGWRDASGAEAGAPEGPIHVVTAIARPGALVAQVRTALGPGTDLTWRGFPDHHEYTAADLRRIAAEAGARTIVSTEKDAVKLAVLDGLPDSTRILTSRLEWDWGREALERALDRVVEREGA